MQPGCRNTDLNLIDLEIYLAIKIAATDTKSAFADWENLQPTKAGFVLAAAILIVRVY